MPRVFKTHIWQLLVPDSWAAQGGDEFVTFFKPDGVGILTVLTFNESSPSSPKGRQVPFQGQLLGTTLTSRHEEMFVRRWTFSIRGKMIVFKYSCSPKNAELEASDLDVMMQSVSESSPAN